jgi:hypothetical protein
MFLCAVVYAAATPVLKHFGAVRCVTVKEVGRAARNGKRSFSETRNSDVAVCEQCIDDVPREVVGIPFTEFEASGIYGSGIH